MKLSVKRVRELIFLRVKREIDMIWFYLALVAIAFVAGIFCGLYAADQDKFNRD